MGLNTRFHAHLHCRRNTRLPAFLSYVLYFLLLARAVFAPLALRPDAVENCSSGCLVFRICTWPQGQVRSTDLVARQVEERTFSEFLIANAWTLRVTASRTSRVRTVPSHLISTSLRSLDRLRC